VRNLVPDVQWVFFFQAEDGIRDRNVTGVQTCALPILKRHPVGCLLALACVLLVLVMQSCSSSLVTLGNSTIGAVGASTYPCEDRSEERRVGKEWRAGWGRDRDGGTRDTTRKHPGQ